MKKPIKNIVCFSLLGISCALISGCSGDIKAKNLAYKVEYYKSNAFAEGEKIGETEVVRGNVPVFHSLSSENPYDWQSTSENEPGYRWVFEKWDGQYTEETEDVFDINDIKHNCKLYPVFKKEKLQYNVQVFHYNHSCTLDEVSKSKILTMSWGEAFKDLPKVADIGVDITGFNPIKESKVLGYKINNIKIDSYENYITKEVQNNITFKSGKGKPTLSTVTNGSFYEDLEDMSFYVYSNNTWNKVGTFANGKTPLIKYNAIFETKYKTYKVKIFDSKTAVSPLIEFDALYGTEFVFNLTSNKFNGQITYTNENGDKVNKDISSLLTKPVESIKWLGNYADNDQVDEKYRGKPVDTQKRMVAGETNFYPKP